MKKKYIFISFIIASSIMLKLPCAVNADTAKVTTETLNLRQEPSTSSNVVELLNADDNLEIISKDGDWYQVKHNGNTGYVNKEYIKVSSESSKTENVTATEEKTETTTKEQTSNSQVTTESTNLNNDETSNFITVSAGTQIKILPLINAQAISTITENSQAEVITKTNKWTYISLDNITGWILNNNFVKTEVDNVEENNADSKVSGTNKEENTEVASNTETKQEETTNSNEKIYDKAKTMYIGASSAYVRSKASTSSSIVTTLIKNTDVKVVGEDEDWYKVEYNSYSGYIHKELLSETKSETTNRSGETLTRQEVTNTSKGEEVVNFAKQYLGCKYVYGASGPSTFDCSGFTMYVYKNFGYTLSHSATAQSSKGTYVEKENLQQGDLVFFSDYETLTGIGHCGIYIGDGNFIHASSGSGYCVKTSTLLSGSYKTRYVTARRLL